jgi:DNA helicase-2/ATP-dependent DNA helicase PcrA
MSPVDLAPDWIADIERVAVLARPFVPASGLGVLGFARLRSSAGTERDLLLGSGSHIEPELALIDWRTAPLAEIFFTYDEGEEYGVEVDGRMVEGRLLRRALLSFENGVLFRIFAHGRELLRDRDRRWMVGTQTTLGPALLPRPLDQRDRTSSILDAELDSVQRSAVDLPAARAALILGEAGCGKTTVALHRLAKIERARGQMNTAVIVPTEGLRVLTEALLERLGVQGAKVYRFDRFAAEQARRAFPDLPKRESEGATGAVMRLKRHPAVRAALRELAKLPVTLPGEGQKVRRTRAHARREDLHALFGDSKYTDQILAEARGELAPASAAETLNHARIQFADDADKEFAHVDLESRQTSDGRGIDAGTPMEDAGSIDAEDYPVLFELDRLRANHLRQKPTSPRQYDCVVLDEAQELAPLELALVGRSLNRGGTLIVAGDADQQVDAGALFGGWAATMRELGQPDHEEITLAVNYRCPPQVTAFARTLRAERQTSRAPILLSKSDTALAPPALLDGDLHVALWLIEALRNLRDSDASASIAVIARSAEVATRLKRTLGFAVNVQLALGGKFNFGPGIQLTCVDEVKGLEFDHVIIPDCTSATYPDTPASRRALYVAATRPRHQLILAGARSLSLLAQLPVIADAAPLQIEAAHAKDDPPVPAPLLQSAPEPQEAQILPAPEIAPEPAQPAPAAKARQMNLF